MTLAYQYFADGYYAGACDDYGAPMPVNSTRLAPDEQEGYIPRWNGESWELVENHMGERGWLDGKRNEIHEYGPYPEGWSQAQPPPTPEEIVRQRETAFTAAIEDRLTAFVRERDWDNLDRALAQRGLFADEAAIIQEAYDAMWAAAIPLFPAVLAGEKSVEEAMEELPFPSWPSAT